MAPVIINLLDHKSQLIKKKSLTAMHRIETLVPGSILLYREKVKKALSETEPSVVNAAVNIISEDCKNN